MLSTDESNGHRSVPYTEVVETAIDHGAKDAVKLNPSKRTMRKAIERLQERGYDSLVKEIEKLLPKPSGKGRKLAEMGESRGFSVQMQGGIDFVRAPTAVIGATREAGSVVTVTPMRAGASRKEIAELIGDGPCIIITKDGGW